MPSIDPTLERPSKSRAIATVTFSEEEYAPAEKAALERLGATVSLKGFRPGKAPLEVLREKIDAERLFEEAIRELLRTTLTSLIDTHNLKPILPPKVEAVSRLPLKLNITFVEYPEVKVKGSDKLSVPKKEIKVDPKDVQRVLDSVIAEQRTFTPVERASKKGDRVVIDFHTADETGKDIPELHAHGYDVIIGDAHLLPGFEEELIGLTANSSKSFTLTLPEKYQNEALKGKPVTFAVEVKRVEEVTAPELTDELAKTKFNTESAAAFKQKIEDSIRMQEEQMANIGRERELMDVITKNTEVDIAPEILEEEMRMVIQEWSERLERQGTTPEDWMQQQKKDAKQMEEEFREQARNRTKLRFGISKLLEERQIQLTPEELQAAKQDFLEQVPEEHRAQAEADLQPGTSSYQELQWRTTVGKLMDSLLA